MNYVILAAVTFVLLLNLGVATAGLRLVTTDDYFIGKALADPGAAALANRMHDFQIGRIYADVKFWLLAHLMRVTSDSVHSALRVGMFVGAMLAAAWFAGEWRRSKMAGMLVLKIGAGFLPVWVGYQALLSYPLLWLGWAGVWVMGGGWR